MGMLGYPRWSLWKGEPSFWRRAPTNQLLTNQLDVLSPTQSSSLCFTILCLPVRLEWRVCSGFTEILYQGQEICKAGGRKSKVRA
jgi:hypothetical protein